MDHRTILGLNDAILRVGAICGGEIGVVAWVALALDLVATFVVALIGLTIYTGSMALPN